MNFLQMGLLAIGASIVASLCILIISAAVKTAISMNKK